MSSTAVTKRYLSIPNSFNSGNEQQRPPVSAKTPALTMEFRRRLQLANSIQHKVTKPALENSVTTLKSEASNSEDTVPTNGLVRKLLGHFRTLEGQSSSPDRPPSRSSSSTGATSNSTLPNGSLKSSIDSANCSVSPIQNISSGISCTEVDKATESLCENSQSEVSCVSVKSMAKLFEKDPTEKPIAPPRRKLIKPHLAGITYTPSSPSVPIRTKVEPTATFVEPQPIIIAKPDVVEPENPSANVHKRAVGIVKPFKRTFVLTDGPDSQSAETSETKLDMNLKESQHHNESSNDMMSFLPQEPDSDGDSFSETHSECSGSNGSTNTSTPEPDFEEDVQDATSTSATFSSLSQQNLPELKAETAELLMRAADELMQTKDDCKSADRVDQIGVGKSTTRYERVAVTTNTIFARNFPKTSSTKSASQAIETDGSAPASSATTVSSSPLVQSKEKKRQAPRRVVKFDMTRVTVINGEEVDSDMEM